MQAGPYPPATTTLYSFLAGGAAYAAAAAETGALRLTDAIAGDGMVLVRILFPGVLLGFFGGVVAAILPWGDKSWGARQAFRVMVLGAFAGLAVSLWLSDLPACTRELSDGCVWQGRRWLYEFLGGFVAEQGFLFARAAGRAELARAARAGLSYLTRVTKSEEGGDPRDP